MTTIKWIGLICVASCLAFGACGGYSDNSSGTGDEATTVGSNDDDSQTNEGVIDSSDFSSGLSSDQYLNELTENDAEQLCNETAYFQYQWAFAGLLDETLCEMMSIMVSETPADCEASQVECLGQTATYSDPGTLNACHAMDVDSMYACHVTVGQLEQCLNDMFAYMASFAEELSCDLAGNQAAFDDIMSAYEDGPESCQIIDDLCPGAVEGTPVQ